MKRTLPIDELRAGRISAVNPPARFTPGERVTLEGTHGKLVGRVLAAQRINGEYRYRVEWTLACQDWVSEARLDPAD